MRESFWFLPAVLGLFGIVLAEVMIVIDRAVDGSDLGIFGVLVNRVGAGGSRDILGAIAGSMLGVAATSFSITISVLAIASSTYGPRLVRNFMTDRGNQLVLATYGSVFLYSLVVLRSIRSPDDAEGGFVPDLAVTLSVLLAILGVAVLVYFIHHIADSIQVSTLVRRVSGELVGSVDREWPAQRPERSVPATAPDANTPAGAVVEARDSGYLQAMDSAALVGVAGQHDAVLEMLVRPGDHLIPGEPVARVHGAEAGDVAAAVCAALTQGSDRTPHADLRFAVQQVVELAVRALSPSTNDPFTADNALDELAAGLVSVVRRPEPYSGTTDDDGGLRLITVPTTRSELLTSVFGHVRNYAMTSPALLSSAARLTRRLVAATDDPAVREELVAELELVVQTYADTSPPERDLDDVRRAAVSPRPDWVS